jgi:hypothetical protein
MSITYTVDEFEPSDRQVKVTYTDDQGFVHDRYVNIPHLEDGSIDEEYFQEILKGQLSGVNNQIRVGVITFTDPDATVGIASTGITEPVGVAST